MVSDHIEDEIEMLLLIVEGAVGYDLEDLQPQVRLG